MFMTNSPYPGALLIMIWKALKFHATYVGLGIIAAVAMVSWALGASFDHVKIFGLAATILWILIVGLALYIEENMHHITSKQEDQA